MRIGASPLPTTERQRPAAATTTAGAKPGQTFVEPTRTPVTQGDLRGAIGRAYQQQTGQAPTAHVLDTLTAHASLETGSGAQMYNFNFGGIKGKSPTYGETAKCRTKEVFDGKEVEVRDGFRAYRNLDDGAADYVRLMRGQFGAAVSKAEVGDVDGFAHALKQAHYYTADEGKYASALRHLSGIADNGRTSNASALSMPLNANALMNGGIGMNGIAGMPNTNMMSLASNFGGGGGSGSGASGDGGGAYPNTVELSRVMDAIGTHHRVTIEDPDDDD